MATPVQDISALNSTRLKGGADVYSTAGIVADASIVSEDQNYGGSRRRTYGDGRQWCPIQTATPSTLTNGQYWIEVIAGVSYIRFVDHAGQVQTLAPSATSIVTPTLLSVGANTLASVNVDLIGVASWYVGLTKGGQRALYRVDIGHNGTSLADATTTQITVSGGVVMGSVDVTLTATLTGTGVTQMMNLIATPASTNWYAYARDDVQVPA